MDCNRDERAKETAERELMSVDPSADEATLKQRLARLIHPDNIKSSAESACKILNEPWSVLSDKSKKFEYDEKMSERGGSHSQQRKSHAETHDHTVTPGPPPSNGWVLGEDGSVTCDQCGLRSMKATIYNNRNVRCAKCYPEFLAKFFGPKSSAQRDSSLKVSITAEDFDRVEGRESSEVQHSMKKVKGFSDVRNMLVEMIKDKARREAVMKFKRNRWKLEQQERQEWARRQRSYSRK